MESTFKEGQDNLRCELSDAEMLEYGKRQSTAIAERMRLEEELETFKKQAKAAETKLTAEINDLSERIRNGYEFRFVETEIETNFDEELVKFWRKDTGECYRQRSLNKEERQLALEAKDTELVAS